jgi:hypothetical protein
MEEVSQEYLQNKKREKNITIEGKENVLKETRKNKERETSEKSPNTRRPGTNLNELVVFLKQWDDYDNILFLPLFQHALMH